MEVCVCVCVCVCVWTDKIDYNKLLLLLLYNCSDVVITVDT